MAEISSIVSGNKRKNPDRPQKRSTRVDLTPMVDLGFLLITFFVFTTTLTQPTAMDINSPEDGPPKEIRATGAMTILLAGNENIFYYSGEFSSDKQLKPVSKVDLREVIMQKKNSTDAKHLMFIIKAGKVSTIRDVVDVLDEMTICDIAPGHYAEVEIWDKELEKIK